MYYFLNPRSSDASGASGASGAGGFDWHKYDCTQHTLPTAGFTFVCASVVSLRISVRIRVCASVKASV